MVIYIILTSIESVNSSETNDVVLTNIGPTNHVLKSAFGVLKLLKNCLEMQSHIHTQLLML